MCIVHTYSFGVACSRNGPNFGRCDRFSSLVTIQTLSVMLSGILLLWNIYICISAYFEYVALFLKTAQSNINVDSRSAWKPANVSTHSSAQVDERWEYPVRPIIAQSNT